MIWDDGEAEVILRDGWGWRVGDYQLWGSLNCCERARARLMRRSDRKCDKTTPAQSR